jgi:septum formation topological specificity factor MinE
MSAGKEPADKPRISRLPAPSLFVGPPSRNASNLSLQTASKEGVGKPLKKQPSRLRQGGGSGDTNESPRTPVDSLTPGGFSRRTPVQTSKAEQMSNERTDALWAEMQNTLEEVELSASSGTHVFGPGHSRALEELRTAQIALAQAWAKSEAEDELDTNAKGNKPVSTADILSADRVAKLGHGSQASKGSGKTQLEEDTENDISLARQRREANDRYFQKVNKGVLEVVQKLEEVAKAMKNVEVDSKEIWGDRDSVDTASVA